MEKLSVISAVVLLAVPVCMVAHAEDITARDAMLESIDCLHELAAITEKTSSATADDDVQAMEVFEIKG